MTEINTVNLIEQMRQMVAEAEGGHKVEAGQESFGDVFQQALGQVNDLSKNSESLKTKFELGDPNVSLGDVMIAAQKSTLGLQGTVMVRNKLVQAYQDIMNIPV